MTITVSENAVDSAPITLLDYSILQRKLSVDGIDALALAMPSLLEAGLCEKRYGDIPRWRQALYDLPDISVLNTVLNASSVTVEAEAPGDDQRQSLVDALQRLHPWRKGPFTIADVAIDTEWRSDFKWDRLVSRIESLRGRRVLDVGCGSGYHCWRMRGEGASLVIGIDPTPLFVMQYWALQKYIQDARSWVLPARLESLPPGLECFDTVFSMGVLYHRRSPFDHLLELRDTLSVGGQLVLETLVIDGSEGDVLVPEGRYGKMGNVWFIPSAKTLIQWLKKINFQSVTLVDETATTTEEQRATAWMRFQSLADFLDPNDSTKTVEGYPAPRRAIVTAIK